MNLTKRLVLAASAITITGALGAAGTAQAKTEHCDAKDDPSKVELNFEATTVDTGFAPGSSVCIKAGNVVGIVTVAGDGSITSFNGKGISYYVCDVPGTCDGPSS